MNIFVEIGITLYFSVFSNMDQRKLTRAFLSTITLSFDTKYLKKKLTS